MKNILILSALPEEQKYYLANLDVRETKKIGFIDVKIAKYQHHMVYLATTGMGTTNVSFVLAILATSIDFYMAFFSGTAGGIDKNIKIGDVVVATETFDADIMSIHDSVVGTPFESALINPNTKIKTPRFFSSNAEVISKVKLDGWDFSVFKGRIATSNHFPSPKDLFKMIVDNCALIIDMESNPMYQYSSLSGLSCLVIRGVSNILDKTGSDDSIADSDVSSSDHAAMVVLDCISNIR